MDFKQMPVRQVHNRLLGQDFFSQVYIWSSADSGKTKFGQVYHQVCVFKSSAHSN